jgi:hypothetical protein
MIEELSGAKTGASTNPDPPHAAKLTAGVATTFAAKLLMHRETILSSGIFNQRGL